MPPKGDTPQHACIHYQLAKPSRRWHQILGVSTTSATVEEHHAVARHTAPCTRCVASEEGERSRVKGRDGVCVQNKSVWSHPKVNTSTPQNGKTHLHGHHPLPVSPLGAKQSCPRSLARFARRFSFCRGAQRLHIYGGYNACFVFIWDPPLLTPDNPKPTLPTKKNWGRAQLFRVPSQKTK